MGNATLTYFTYTTAHGPVTISASQRGLTSVAFDDQPVAGENRATALTNDAATQLQEYLAGKRREFDVPLDMQGSAFQKTVWSELCEIPYGEVRSSADLAEAIGKPGSHRSIGTAIRQVKLAPFVPAHRVLAANATGKRARIFRAFRAIEARACGRADRNL